MQMRSTKEEELWNIEEGPGSPAIIKKDL